MRVLLILFALCFSRTCLAWSEGGHHLIAVMAYDLLTEDEKFRLQQILAAHPRFAEDFVVPINFPGVEEANHWRIGRALLARHRPETTAVPSIDVALSVGSHADDRRRRDCSGDSRPGAQ